MWNFSSSDGANPQGKLLFVEDDSYQPETVINSAVAEETTGATVAVYPNPFSENFSVTLSASQPAPVRYVITDLSGNVVHETRSDQPQVNLGDNLVRGIYLLRVISGESVTTQRLVKN